MIYGPGTFTEQVTYAAGVTITGTLGSKLTSTASGTTLTLGARCVLHNLWIDHSGTVTRVLNGNGTTNVGASTAPGAYTALLIGDATDVRHCLITSTDVGVSSVGANCHFEDNIVNASEIGIVAAANWIVRNNVITCTSWPICSAYAIGVSGGDPGEIFLGAVIEGNRIYVSRDDTIGGYPLGISLFVGSAAIVNNSIAVVLESGGSSVLYASGVDVSGQAVVSLSGNQIATLVRDAPQYAFDLLNNVGDPGTLLVGPNNQYDTTKTRGTISTGWAGVDLTNIRQATAPTTLTNVTVPVVTDVTNGSGSTINTAVSFENTSNTITP